MTEKAEPNSRNDVSREKSSGQLWAAKLFLRIAMWSGFSGWEARFVRNNLVYQERLRDAFEAFDAADYAAALTAFKRDADTGRRYRKRNGSTQRRNFVRGGLWG